jgi:hypothetical protein
MEDAGVWGPPVPLPAGKVVTPLKFLFTKKIGSDGSVSRFKARLVYLHRDSKQSEDANSAENVYAPVVDRASVRVFLAFVASNRWFLYQADVQTAFLNAVNEGEDYVSLPSMVCSTGNRVRLLYKAIYGLKRAPKMWNDTFTQWATGEGGYICFDAEPCMFMNSDRSGGLIIYVDDILVAAKSEEKLRQMIDGLDNAFKIRVIGKPTYFLGMNVRYYMNDRVMLLWQQTYIRELVEKFGGDAVLPCMLPIVPETELNKLQSELTPTSQPYSSLVGALLFLSTSTGSVI